MKLLSLLTAFALAAVPAFTFAAEPAPGGPPPREEGPGKPGKGAMRHELRELAKLLDLTESQKEAVRAIFKERRDAMEDLSKEERRGEAGRKIREDSQQKIRALLNPEQQAKFDTWAKEMREKHGGKGGYGKKD